MCVKIQNILFILFYFIWQFNLDMLTLYIIDMSILHDACARIYNAMHIIFINWAYIVKHRSIRIRASSVFGEDWCSNRNK